MLSSLTALLKHKGSWTCRPEDHESQCKIILPNLIIYFFYKYITYPSQFSRIIETSLTGRFDLYSISGSDKASLLLNKS